VSTGNGLDPARHRTSRPYRDSALAYGALGVIAVLFAYFTGTALARSLIGGFVAFALATSWTWWRLYARERKARRAKP
jgi:hypothetical protein